jgi:glycogen operon protein
MFVMGDEVRRTQHGNNNAYCEDNETTWFDWSLLIRYPDVHRFVKLLAARRLLRGTDARRHQMTLAQLISGGLKGWHGIKLHEPDWSEHSHSIALNVELPSERLLVYCIFTSYWEPLEFELPSVDNGEKRLWRRWIDTSLDSPQDIVEWQTAPPVPSRTYRAGPRSVVVLWASLDERVR